MNSLDKNIETEPQATIKLEINFSSDEALKKIATYKQSDFILKIYRSSHGSSIDGPEKMAGLNLRKRYLIDTLGADMPYGLDKHYTDEIIKQPTPLQNIDEEELRLLDRYKGAIVSFGQSYLFKSNLPEKIRSTYGNAESMTEFQLDVAWWGALGWYDKHPEANTPIKPNPLTTETFRILHKQMQKLIYFYNSNRLIPNIENITDDEGNVDLINHPEALPIIIVDNYYSLFCPTGWQFENFNKSVGF
ncbi:MAG TPA: hypothetical protein VMR19_04675 [Candidatus Saccharimonadales bacterium]|nr:hypothetical protein [Candidatus Saccharimonadales bacterium]